MSKRGRPASGSEIDRDQWIAAAIFVLDERGRSGFTLAAVARHLGATTMALYRHFEGRDELIDAAIDQSMRLPARSAQLDGADAVEADVRLLMALLVRRPWLAFFVLEGRASRPAVLTLSERLIGALLACGLNPAGAHLAWQLLLGVLVASAAQADAGEPPPAPSLDGYPNLAFVTAELAVHPPKDMPAALVKAILAGARALSEP